MCHPEPELLSERERSGDGPSPCPPPSALLRSAAVLVPGVRRDPPPRAAAPGVCLKSNQISTLGGFKMQVTSYSTQMKKKSPLLFEAVMPRCSTEVRPAIICVWGGLATRARLQFKVYTCYILKVDYNISRFNVRSSDYFLKDIVLFMCSPPVYCWNH